MNTRRLDLHSALALLVLAGALWFSGPGSRPAVPTVGVEEARQLIDAGALVIDVRERADSAGAHLPGSLLIPLGLLSGQLPVLQAAREKTIVVYCGSGGSRGPEAVRRLSAAGFPSVVNLDGGFSGWRKAGLPVTGA